MRAQVDIDRPIPGLDRTIGKGVAGVVGGIVDQDGDRAMGAGSLGHGAAKCVDIGNVAGLE